MSDIETRSVSTKYTGGHESEFTSGKRAGTHCSSPILIGLSLTRTRKAD